MGDHNAGGARQVQNGLGDSGGSGVVQGGGGLVQQQHWGAAQQAPGDGDALAFAAGQVHAVFPAAVVLTPHLEQLEQPGPLHSLCHLLLREGAEHGEVVADGVVKEKYILPHEAHQVIEAVGVHVPQLGAVDGDGAGIGPAGSHEQVQQGGLAGAGAAHDGVGLPGLELGGEVLQDGLVRLVAEGHVVQGDGLAQRGGDGYAALLLVLSGELCQLVHEGQGGFAGGPVLGHRLDGIEKQAAQVDHDEHGARGDLPSDGQIGTEEEDAELNQEAQTAA